LIVDARNRTGSSTRSRLAVALFGRSEPSPTATAQRIGDDSRLDPEEFS
jgi:hypothetical protein